MHPWTRTKRRRGSMRRTMPYLLLAPTVAIVGVVLVYPMASTVRRSFHSWPFAEPGNMTFVGLDNYRALADSSSTFIPALAFTAGFTLACLVLEFGLAIAGALLLDRINRGRSLLASIVIAPYMVAPIAVGLVWRLMLTRDIGLANYLLSFVGLDPVNWLGSTAGAIASTIIAETWMSMPFTMLILLAGLTSIPEDVVEAGQADGASEPQLFRYIVVPLLMPSIAVALIFSTIFKLRVFDLVLTLTGGGPGDDTTPLGLMVQRMFFRYFEGGVASAVSVVLLFLGGAISVLYVRYVYREVKY